MAAANAPPTTQDARVRGPERPSSALHKAATHEETRISRTLATLDQRRAALRAQLADLDREAQELTRRQALLDELLATDTGARRASPRPAAAAGPSRGAIRGRETRRVAARLLWTTEGAGAPVHYRELYERVLAAGYAVTGQDPLASFLTNLRDSPAIVSTDRPGYYQLDHGQRDRTAHEISETQAELAATVEALSKARRRPADATNVDPLRACRDELLQRLRRLEADARELDAIFAVDAA
jgi:hypothetical protein